MTTHGLSQAELDKIHAAISQLIDQTIQRNEESRKVSAEVPKPTVEACKFTRETFWYPMAVVTGLYCVIAVIMTVIYRLLH
jgi:quinol-cytochrome oxidoreductase complex cytochrome b subunit